MKTNFVRIVAAASLVLFSCQQGYSQGTFQNLNFENPIPPLTPGPNGLVPTANALPGWTAYINDNPRDFVFFSNIALGSPSISVVDSLSPGYQPIQGNYSVFFRSAGLGQTGQIPNDASSLFFLREPLSFFLASFGGQSIPLVEFGASGNNIIMAGDISMFAGQAGELRFVGTGLFDDMQFSNQPIPEPGTFCLFGLGALLLGWRFLCKRT